MTRSITHKPPQTPTSPASTPQTPPTPLKPHLLIHTNALLLKIALLTNNPNNTALPCLDRIASKRIRDRSRKLPRADPLLEQNIQLAIGLALGLRQAEIRPHETEGAETRPEKPCLSAPVPRGRVDHARGDDVIEDADDIVEIAGQHDSFAAEAGGGDLGDETVADGADGEVVGEGVDDEHGADDPGGSGVGGRGQGDKADDQQEGVEADQAGEVEGAAAESGHQEPGEHGADGAEGVLAHGKVEGVGGVEPGLFVELHRVAHQAGAAQGLGHPDHGGDFGAAEIGLAQAVEIAGSDGGFLFEFIGVHHHGDGLGRVEIGVASAGKAAESAFGVLEAAVADEPPGGLGREEDADHEGDGPHPLQGKGNSVAPLVGIAEHAS